MLENQRNTSRGRLRVYLYTLIAAFVGYILFICLNTIVGSDVMFAGTMLYELTEWIYLGLELIAFFVAFAFTIHAVFSRGWRHALTYAWVYAAVTGGRYVVLYLLNWLFFGLQTEDMLFQAAMTVVTLLLELMQYAAVFGVALVLTDRFDQHVVSFSRDQQVYPHRRLPLLNDPLRGSSFLAALLLGVVRVGGRLIFDASYGAPTDAVDLLWMLAYYTVDILIAVACYFVLLAIIKRLSLTKAE
jgi:hypothetical protein